MSSSPVAAADLDRRSAIHDAVVAFYREVVFDDVLAPVFTEVAEVDWAEHIPKLIDYWCRVLLGDRGSRGELLAAHRHVHEQSPFEPVHFERWYTLWVQVIDSGWSGPKAEQAKHHAARIGGVIARHLAPLAGQVQGGAPLVIGSSGDATRPNRPSPRPQSSGSPTHSPGAIGLRSIRSVLECGAHVVSIRTGNPRAGVREWAWGQGRDPSGSAGGSGGTTLPRSSRTLRTR